jgi:predicted ester cyclase
MGALRWTPERMEQLERAVREGRRVVLRRRGTEYVVVARRVFQEGQRDALIGFLPMTGEELRFNLEELDEFHVLA